VDDDGDDGDDGDDDGDDGDDDDDDDGDDDDDNDVGLMTMIVVPLTCLLSSITMRQSAGGAGRAHQHEGGVYRGRDLDGVPDFVPVNLDGGRVAAHLWGRGAAGAGARGGHVVSAGESEMAGAEE